MNKEILRLAIPNILSNLSVPLLSTVDTILMGNLSALHIGAVGIGSMIFNFVYWNFGFLRMGTTGMTAQAFGSEDKGAMANTLFRSFLLAVMLASLVVLFQNPLGEAGVYLMNVAPEQIDLVLEYFTIRIWDAPATLLIYVMMGWFFGMQNAIYPLMLTIFINTINIAVSYWMVTNLGWGIEGVAWGTVIAQYSGVVLAILLWIFRYGAMTQLASIGRILRIEELKGFLQINGDLFIRTICLTFAFGFFYSRSSADGTLVLAANVILQHFLNWLSYGVDGFAYASESLVGKYKGKADMRTLNRVVKLSFGWGMGLAVLIATIYWFAGDWLLNIFTTEANVIEAAQPYLLWVIILCLVATPCYIWDGVFIGLTASKEMRNSMLLSLICYLGIYYMVVDRLGNHGLWLALTLFLLLRGTLLFVIYRRKF